MRTSGPLLFLLLFVSGAGVGWMLRGTGEVAPSPRPPSRATTTPTAAAQILPRTPSRALRFPGTTFIRPLVDCDFNDDEAVAAELVELRSRAEQVIAQARRAGRAARVSVYFRDIEQGAGFGVRENELYEPASLIKVYVLAGLLARAEEEPGLLRTLVRYPETLNRNERQFTMPRGVLERGVEHSLAAYAEVMITESDNDALAVLVPWTRAYAARFGEATGVVEVPGGTELLVSPFAFGNLLRALYNASMLSEQSSEQALELLSRTTYRDALVAPLPDDVIVAHKFGEHGAAMGDGLLHQLHDCGIIYQPARPYILCVMTQGYSFGDLARTIAEISGTIWQARTAPSSSG